MSCSRAGGSRSRSRPSWRVPVSPMRTGRERSAPAGTFAIFAYVLGRTDTTEYLGLFYLPGAGELSIFALALAGACLGFLWYNAHPADVFMGDTGSLAIGGAIGVMAILLGGALFSLGSVSLFGSTLLGAVYTLLITVGVIAGAFGIANEKAWGYKLGVAAAAAPLALRVVVLFIAGLEALTFDTVGLLFDIALIALLLHPMSRDYQKVWFR